MAQAAENYPHNEHLVVERPKDHEIWDIVFDGLSPKIITESI